MNQYLVGFAKCPCARSRHTSRPVRSSATATTNIGISTPKVRGNRGSQVVESWQIVLGVFLPLLLCNSSAASREEQGRLRLNRGGRGNFQEYFHRLTAMAARQICALLRFRPCLAVDAGNHATRF